jgi:hypothetical protein
MALVVFAVCLLIGGLQAGNPFTTTVIRAIVAMAGTLVVGLVIGGMAQKMLDENIQSEEKKLKENEGRRPINGSGVSRRSISRACELDRFAVAAFVPLCVR